MALTSFQELEVLGEALVRDYFKKTHRWNSMSLDIEGFIKDYLGLNLVYESIAEEDKSKIGFSADGMTPLLVYRDGRPDVVVYPKDTLVIDQYLRRSDECGRRRFTMAHEAAHNILGRHVPMQMAGFHSDYDAEADYSNEDLKRIFSMNEAFANRLGAVILMPSFLVEKARKKYHPAERFTCFQGGVIPQEEKLSIQRMADALGVNYSAMVNRLKELNLLDYHPIEEYLENDLQVGGNL